VLDECLLESRQPSAISQALYSDDGAVFDLAHRHEAAIDDFAIDEYRARPALAFAASFFGAGFAEVFAQHVEEPPGTRSFE